MPDQIVKIFEQFDRTGSSIRQVSARSDARPQAFPPSRNDDRRHRTHASDPEGSVSNSVDWAPRATRLPRFGMRFSLRDSKQLPGACLARPQNVCTATCRERKSPVDGRQWLANSFVRASGGLKLPLDNSGNSLLRPRERLRAAGQTKSLGTLDRCTPAGSRCRPRADRVG